MRLPAIACAAMLVLALPASAGAAEALSGRLIVGFTKGTSHERAASLVQGAGARIERRLDRIGALLIRSRHGERDDGPARPAAPRPRRALRR